ncbi:hypothetical protein WH47_05250, partial [Habropoda laboriosa]
KSKQGTGCAVCTPERDLQFRLPEAFTVFSSEAFAILQALKYIEQKTHNKFIIFSDSKSVVTALQNLETRNTIIRNIIELNAILNCGEKEILYSWIPSHANIEGNEKADSAAKLVSTSTSESNDVPILYQDLQNYLTKAAIESWNEE